MSKKPASKKPIPKKNTYTLFNKLKYLLPALVISLITIAAIFTTFQLFFLNRLYPFVYINNLSLAAKTPEQSEKVLKQTLLDRSSKILDFNSSDNQRFQIDLQQTYSASLEPTLSEAFKYGRSKFYYQPISIKTPIIFNEKLDKQLDKISQSINEQPIDAQLKVDADQITVTPSQNGSGLDKEKLKSLLEEYLATGNLPSDNLPVKIIEPALDYQTALTIKKSLDQIKLSPLVLKHKDLSWTIDLQTALKFINLTSSKPLLASGQINGNEFSVYSVKIGSSHSTDTQIVLDETKIEEYLKNISVSIDQPIREPLLSFDPAANGGKGRISEFQPPQEGRSLDIKKSKQLITKTLLSENHIPLELPVQTIQPKNKLVNDLGIKELIGRGVSHFAGSIPNRIFNIAHTAAKINGVLVPPGEEFSFVNTVGDISAATGFKQAYVIKSGRTVLDDGGGVCQDSTTLFRAALNAGLPITARTAHAYRVAYYEQGFPPGLDATIFHPTVDFRFKNDTPAHILIQASVTGTTLTIDLYGTSDGRVAEISAPVITKITPAPPELRQDDPTLPKGTVKQVDWAASGANVVFTRKVTKNGQVLIDESFRSNYRPWQAVYLVGTKEN